MGRRKFLLGRHRKNAERIRQQYGLNSSGRPLKQKKICTAKESLVEGSESVDINQGESISAVDINQIANIPLPSSWVKESDTESIKLYKIVGKPPVISHNVVINKDCTWSAYVSDKAVHDQMKEQYPSTITNAQSLQDLVVTINEYHVCPGNPDSHFVSMLVQRKGRIISKDGSITAILDNDGVIVNKHFHDKTVRASSCQKITKGSRCCDCETYRNTLRSLYSKLLKSRSKATKRLNTASHINDRYLSTPERRKKVIKLREEKRDLHRQVNVLKQKIDKLTQKNGINLDDALSSDLQEVMDNSNDTILQKYPPNSFHRIFWEQHSKAIRQNDARQIRWHPAMIKWCLSLKLQSSSCYNALRSSGVIKLPSERTLRDYTNWTKATTGLNTDVDKQLLTEAKIHSSEIPSYHQYIALIFDECKVKEDLIYDKHTGELIGYSDITEINTHLRAVEQSCKESEAPVHELATHMLTFFVRGLFSSLMFPYAQFSVKDVTGNELFTIFWAVVQRLELLGFKVLVGVCDGAAANRRFIKVHGDKDTYYTKNPYSELNRPIYFISDASHLIKTVRNCWANSYGHSHTRTLWINGQDIKWTTVVHMYEKHCISTHSAPGLSILPKLHYEHIHLNSYSKMRVDLACQILSKSVAEAISLANDTTLKETERFVRKFNKFFDIMNIRCTTEYVRTKNANKKPFYHADDDRLKWLQDELLGYLDEWNKSVNSREGFTKKQKAAMTLSLETIQGLKITINSTVDLIRYSLKIPGVKYFLTEHLMQDCLEAFFGQQRAKGGRNDNPSVKSFLENTASLRIQGSQSLKPFRGNCMRKRKLATPVIIDETPLPKRRRQSSKNTK